MNSTKKISMAALSMLLALFLSTRSYAHCEIPCGIYGDSVRITMILEHITTIEKSMNQIMELSEAETPNYNQLVRWVVNKEEHAVKLQDIVSQYFLHQRIKPVSPDLTEDYKKYQHQLELLHHMQVFAMKCKQTTDLSFVEKLRDTVSKFEKSYFHSHDHQH